MSSRPLVHVHWASRTDADERWLDVADDVERERYSSYRQQADRDRFLVGFALVRTLAARATGRIVADVGIDRTCDRCGGPHGRPRVVDADLVVSVSHAGDAVVVASCTGIAVGVDVEQIPDERTARELIPAALGADEAATTAAEFASYWTRKEAVLKCTGDGFRIAPNEVLVTAPHRAPALRDYPGRAELSAGLTIRGLAHHPVGYCAALAVLHPESPEIQEDSGNQLLRAALGRSSEH